jgi:hypothetical protein
MSYIDYLNQFSRLNQEETFDVYQRALYTVLLAFFNDRKWQQPQQFADVFLGNATDIKSVNTLKKARAGLVARGLIEFDGGHQGAGKKGEYRLLQVGEDQAEKPSPKLSRKLSPDDSLSTDEEEKLSRKLSPDDTNIKSIDNKIDVTEREPSAREKNLVGVDFRPNGAAASASHTGGGAAPLPEDLPARPGFIDPRLSDDDPRKWEAFPRDVEMIDDYLRNHPSPELNQHAGKGHLYWAEYAGGGWVYGRFNRQIRNWREHIKGFSFIDFKAQRQAQQAASGISEVEKRNSAGDDAKAILRAKRQQNQGYHE